MRHRIFIGCAYLLALTACTPGLYKRGVTARVSGPSQLLVGEKIFLEVRLEYSDGEVFPTGPSSYNASANAAVDWVSSNSAIASVGAQTGLVTAIAAGEVTITATPGVTTTGTGQRTAGTIRIAVTG